MMKYRAVATTRGLKQGRQRPEDHRLRDRGATASSASIVVTTLK
jgi:hypothetical protein